MMPLFGRITIISLGMLGGSVALSARARGLAKEIIGVSRSEETIRKAEAQGYIDRGAVDPRLGVHDSELVVLASPVYAMEEIVRKIAPDLMDGAIVTDVGSVKHVLAESLPPLLPENVSYVGSHPMTGSHKQGFDSARADLLEGAACVVTSTNSDVLAVERVCAFWSSLGMRVVLRDPIGHDKEAAWVSHLPHAVAFAYAKALNAAPEGEFELRGSGFRDFTRIGKSDPALWANILIENRHATLEALSVLSETINSLNDCIVRNDLDALENFIATGREILVDGRNNSCNSKS